MIKSTETTTAARFMFVYNEEIIFCTSDLNAYKKAINPHDIGQISSQDQVLIHEEAYTIESIQIEHYSWPMDHPTPNQAGQPYLYTINVTLNLSKTSDDQY
ncbi:hypothetical protein [Mucilaginibacter lacusdianchii]|uniref:hypothetical protein n=1 Tax=Mucilaginibacter lacusdianchii TaxID=2684211 RepID=UPI00131A962A|nr:hypothetical protein [Mucilaginibacter sp. JXJ CY 39]